MQRSGLRNLIARSSMARLAFNYARNLDNRYLRTAILATDGPAAYKRRLWKRYLTPDPAWQPVPLSSEYAGYLEQLRSEGIVSIPGHFESVATQLRALIEEMGLTNHRRQDNCTDWVVDFGYAVPGVLKMLADPQLCGLFCNYYGRQAYYREHPSMAQMSSAAPEVDESAGHVHCDGYRQLTFTLLLNDITVGDTHLVFYAGTHHEPKLNYDRISGNLQRVAGCREVLGVGRAGTLLVFDAGSGYHRGQYLAGKRQILRGVVTTGWLPFKDQAREDSDALLTLNGAPAYVRAMFDRQ